MSRKHQSLAFASVAYSQVAQSALNLVATLLFVNMLSPGTFGVLAGFWLIWMLWLSMHRSVFGEQIISQGLKHKSSEGYLEFIVLWVAVAGAGSVLLAILIDLPDIVQGLVYLALFTSSDAVRYYVIASNERERPSGHRRMILVDSTRLVLAVIAFIPVLSKDHLAAGVFVANLAAGAWLFVMVARAKPSRWRKGFRYPREKGNFEKLLIIQFLVGAGVSQAAPLLSLVAFGSTALGGIRLAQSLLSPINLISTALQPALISVFRKPERLRTLSEKLFPLLLLAILAGAALALCANAALITFSELLIPDSYSSVVSQVSFPISVMIAAAIVGQPGAVIIRIMRLGKASLYGQLFGATITMTVGLIAMQFSLTLFAWALTTGSLSTVFATFALVTRELKRRAE